MWCEFDLQMFLDYLNEERENVDESRFFDLIKQRREEWLSKDLVVDVRESWKTWTWRQMHFEDPPLIPREDLPDQY